MKEAVSFLFEDLFNGKPLFKSQLDLAIQLLNDPDNPYSVNAGDAAMYSKAQTRLKTYISQLLSNNVTRSITEDFKTGLLSLLNKKLPPGSDTDGIVDDILRSLEIKNAKSIKSEYGKSPEEQLTIDFHNSAYITIITSKPLEIDLKFQADTFSLRSLLFMDLIRRLSRTDMDLKYYRFNFPLDSYCDLFWRGLRRILKSYIEEQTENLQNGGSIELFDSLYSKFALKTATITELKTNFKKENIPKIVDEIIMMLNRNRYIMVFNTKAPIYSMPILAFNPSDSRNMKVYSLLSEEQKETPNIFKYPEQESVLWRVFVWDKLKSSIYAGENFAYPLPKEDNEINYL